MAKAGQPTDDDAQKAAELAAEAPAPTPPQTPEAAAQSALTRAREEGRQQGIAEGRSAGERSDGLGLFYRFLAGGLTDVAARVGSIDPDGAEELRSLAERVDRLGDREPRRSAPRSRRGASSSDRPDGPVSDGGS